MVVTEAINNFMVGAPETPDLLTTPADTTRQPGSRYSSPGRHRCRQAQPDWPSFEGTRRWRGGISSERGRSRPLIGVGVGDDALLCADSHEADRPLFLQADTGRPACLVNSRLGLTTLEDSGEAATGR